MIRENSKEILEFSKFVNQENVYPPATVTKSILKEVHGKLNPSLKKVTTKFFLLHSIAAFIVMLFCPQLGVNALLLGGHGVMHFFMAFGPSVCAGLCGAFFLGTSCLFATMFLKREELLLANRYRFLNVSFLMAISFTTLILLGGEAERFVYLFWIIGAVVGGWFMMKLGFSVRSHIYSAQWNLN